MSQLLVVGGGGRPCPAARHESAILPSQTRHSEYVLRFLGPRRRMASTRLIRIHRVRGRGSIRYISAPPKMDHSVTNRVSSNLTFEELQEDVERLRQENADLRASALLWKRLYEQALPGDARADRGSVDHGPVERSRGTSAGRLDEPSELSTCRPPAAGLRLPADNRTSQISQDMFHLEPLQTCASNGH